MTTLDGDPDIAAAAAEYGIPVDEFIDMIGVSVGNRLITDC